VSIPFNPPFLIGQTTNIEEDSATFKEFPLLLLPTPFWNLQIWTKLRGKEEIGLDFDRKGDEFARGKLDLNEMEKGIKKGDLMMDSGPSADLFAQFHFFV
jgi:hypothetical protein